MSNESICCPQCKGKAKIYLKDANPALARTLQTLRKAGPSHAEDMLNRMGRLEYCGATGMSNRLAELFRLGFATRTKQGKFWIYEATTKKSDK